MLLASARVLTNGIILVGAAAALYLFVYIPYEQQIRKKTIEHQLRMMYDRTGGHLAPADVQRLHTNISWLTTAIRYSPHDAVLYVQLASSYAMLERYDDAIAMYKQALVHSRRREIYTALAAAQLYTHDVEDAVTSYAHAAAFYPKTLLEVSETIVPEVSDRVRKLYGPRVAESVARR